jgi:hypothetical protein
MTHLTRHFRLFMLAAAVIAFRVVFAVLPAGYAYWIFACGGAEFLADHPGLSRYQPRTAHGVRVSTLLAPACAVAVFIGLPSFGREFAAHTRLAPP